MSWIASIVLIAVLFSVYYLEYRLEKAERKSQHQHNADAKM